jgi:hypothetical protein
MLPFKRTFKHASRLALSIPDAFLQSGRALGLTNLFQRLITNHSTLFAKHISMDNSLTLKKVMLLRLASIQQDLLIPYSPLFVDNFRPFTKLPAYRDDYILRLLSFSLDLGIRYTIPPAAPFPTDVHHTPIHILFSDNPSLYKSSVYQLRKHKIMYLSDCISNDGMALIPFQQLIKLHSGLHTSSITPKWYKYIAAITAEAPNSIRLKDEYKKAQLALKRPISTDLQDTRSPLNVMHIPNRKQLSSFWCATWDYINNQPIFGRTIYNTRSKVYIQHWIIDPTPPSATASRTPSSRLIKLIECPGCNLHDLTTQESQDNRPPSKKVLGIPCVFTELHRYVVSLKHLEHGQSPYRYRRDDYDIRSTLYQLIPQIKLALVDRITDINLSSPPSPAPLGDEHINLGLFFTNGHTYQCIPKPHFRHFIKQLFSAANFAYMLQLNRWADISSFHDQRMINWDASWSAFHYHEDGLKITTSFNHSARVSFSSKLMLNELPLLSTLRTRKPTYMIQTGNVSYATTMMKHGPTSGNVRI